MSMAGDSVGGDSAGDGISLLKGPHSYPFPSTEDSERQRRGGSGTGVDGWHGHAFAVLKEQSPWS